MAQSHPVVSRALRDPYPLRFTGDGRMLVAGMSHACGFMLPDLAPAFRVRPLKEPRGFAIQPRGGLILCASSRGEFALLNSSTGETLAICADKHHLRDHRFALSACGAFAIYDNGDSIRVREIATGRVTWERNVADGHVSDIQPVRHGEAWLFSVYTRVATDPNASLRMHLEVWTWPFGAEPRQILRPPLTNLAIASGSGRIVVQGALKPGVAGLQVYEEGAGGSTAEQELHYMDRLIGFVADEHFATANDSGVQLREAGSGTVTCRVELPGYSRYACSFAPDGASLAVAYGESGFAYAHGVLEGRPLEARVENPFPAKRPHRTPARKPAADPWYRLPPPKSVRSIDPTSIEHAKTLLHELRRPAWAPIVAADAGPITASKFGGTPYLADPGSWPRCGTCGEWLQLALQLNAADLPPEQRSLFAGILQVFFCAAEACAPVEPFSPATLVRLTALSGTPAYERPPFDGAFIESRITGWEAHVDYPTADELELRGVRFANGPDIGGEFWFPLAADKLMGWPGWPQNVDYVKCPTCGGAMQTIVQLGSEQNVPYMFGDGGTAWVSQCPVHRSKLTFHCNW